MGQMMRTKIAMKMTTTCDLNCVAGRQAQKDLGQCCSLIKTNSCKLYYYFDNFD